MSESSFFLRIPDINSLPKKTPEEKSVTKKVHQLRSPLPGAGAHDTHRGSFQSTLKFLFPALETFEQGPGQKGAKVKKIPLIFFQFIVGGSCPTISWEKFSGLKSRVLCIFVFAKKKSFQTTFKTLNPFGGSRKMGDKAMIQ